MKDMLGVEVEVGDVALSCAANRYGRAKLGRVYAFDKNGNPMIEYMGSKYNLEVGKYEDAWQRGSAGSHVLVLSQGGEFSIPEKLGERIMMEYPSGQ